MVALIVYVDDIIITGDWNSEIQRLKRFLATQFEVKDLGPLRYFLGIEVARSNQGIFISQRKYVLDLLKDTGKLGAKLANTPIDVNHRLEDCSDEPIADMKQYQRLVGRLLYLSMTRPNIAYAVGVLSQFMHAPKATHLEAAHRVLRYLKKFPGTGLLFGKHEHIRVEVYTDADWAGSVDDRKSTSGYCALVGGNLVTWRSKKQSVVARSSVEAEYRAMSHGVAELLWIKNLLGELDFPLSDPIEKLEKGEVCPPYISSEEQLADIFTKGLNSMRHYNLCDKLGMIDVYAPT
ncbi:PREDICTED: uncharacterized protein LOC109114922 [Nelumbo nucifera]|uniref:Uncharacterized protein LOC109114922 n=1 Tax=Nelumbo nucifera TaxID=4432 RepID=A0A1U8Q791_NELNU|nr:PREDICTED: uncharacterized protein LOC109114922 [Nelumbo nucifera]